MTSLGTWETVLCELEDGVATVTLNRPQSLNLMDMQMRDELRAVLFHLEEEPMVRAVIITGAGDAFSGGGDMNDFVERSPEEMHDVMREKSHRWFESLWHLTKPTIAAVNGVAAGGAVNLVLACDLVVASDRARFGETFVRVGLIPDLGGLFLLPRTVGLHRAKALCLTGDLLNAEEAHRLGIVYEVVAHDELDVSARALALRLAAGPPHAYAAIKKTLNRSFELAMDDVLQLELYAQSFLFGTRDHEIRLNGFLGNGDAEP